MHQNITVWQCIPLWRVLPLTSCGMKIFIFFNTFNTGSSLKGIDELALHNSYSVRAEQKTRVIISADLITEVKKAASWDAANSTSWDKDQYNQGLLGPEVKNVFPCWALPEMLWPPYVFPFIISLLCGDRAEAPILCTVPIAANGQPQLLW